MNAGIKAFVTLLFVPTVAMAQGFLDEFSYEGIRFTGIGFGVGGTISNRLETAITGAGRADLGMIAPKIRVMVGLSYFQADFKEDEIAKFEDNLRDLVDDPTGDFEIDIGTVTWADLEAALDLQYVAPISDGIAGFAGVGLGLHLRNGWGDAIDGTFVEDALDGIDASLDLSLGGHIRLVSSLYFTLDVRGGLSTDLLTAAGLAGFQYRIPR
ncbi:MAG: hypothetical protein JSW51_06550 [Gemmatimonadota bacterium]|nr:MAG: hypothetical protein JSW51_06550 [Gemmatimonadota bacterium]